MSKKGKCPYCGGTRILRYDYSHNSSDDILIEKCHCHACDKRFDNVYSLTFLYNVSDAGSKI